MKQDKNAVIIAVDGLAASGKGTLARSLAGRLGLAYLDTGGLYRLVAWHILQNQIDPADEAAVTTCTQAVKPDPDRLAMPVLRSEDVSQTASRISVYEGVRGALVEAQRHFACYPPDPAKGAVLDGRDIGTVICPDAGLKLFVTAAPEVRAHRRTKELQLSGTDVTYEAVLEEMRIRDARDQTRSLAPTKPANDAQILQTDDKTPEQVLETALEMVRKVYPDLF